MAIAGVTGATVLSLALAAPASARGSSTRSSHSLTVGTAKVSKIGTVLTTSSGLTLYRFTADPAGKATCTGVCAKVWPPLMLPKGDHLKGPHGVKGLSTIRVGHGHEQVAFHHEALYRFAGDKKKGQAKGQGVEGMWFAVLSNGHSSDVTHAASPNIPATPGSTTPSSTTPGQTSTPNTAPNTTPTPTSPTTPVTQPTPVTTPTTPTTQPAPTTTTTTAPPPSTTTTTQPSGGYGY
jgi:predicted lipoprotein with Yx(FWY)xxD motif